MGNGMADGFQLGRLESYGLEGGEKIEQHVGGKTNLSCGNGQHSRFSSWLGVEAGDHMVDVVGGGDALGQPKCIGAGVARPEEFRVVVELANHAGIGAAEAAFGQLFKRCEVRLEGWIALVKHFSAPRQGAKAGDANPHGFAVDEVVDQITDAVQPPTALGEIAQDRQILHGAQQFSGFAHQSMPPLAERLGPLYSAVEHP